MRKALIVVDVQNDFCEGGALAVAGGKAVAKKISDFVRLNPPYYVSLATRDYHVAPGSHWSENPDFIDSWPKHCEAGTKGSEMLDDFIGFAFDEYFLKGEYEAAYSGFEGHGYLDPLTSLDEFLVRNKITHVDVVGLALDYCVAATAKDAAQKGYVTRVLLDKTAAVHSDPASILRTVRDLERAGVSCV